MSGETRRGPLAGCRVVEFAGIGPGPLCGMLLADLGADVVVVDRPANRGLGSLIPRRFLITNRGKRLTAVDAKTEEGRAAVLGLLDRADALLEGFRPGTMERLRLGPDLVLSRNARIVYARITGWGQAGPRASTAGHDISYIALTGALSASGRAGEAPVPPVNFLGDYAGGTMFALVGILAALLEATRSGKGQVVDAAMVDGVGAMLAPMLGMLAAGAWKAERGSNLIDTGAPFYDVYRTRDDKYLAIGALEDEFFGALSRVLGLSPESVAERWNPASWPALRARIAAVIASRSRDDWVLAFEGSDACAAPVLALGEAPDDPHNRARNAFVSVDGVIHPAPAPRFSRTPSAAPSRPPESEVPIEEVLREWNSRE